MRWGRVQFERDASDRAQVLGHVLAVVTVAAGGTDLELAVLVNQFHGQAVQLDLGDVLDIRVASAASA